MDHDFLAPNDSEHKRSDSVDWDSADELVAALKQVLSPEREIELDAALAALVEAAKQQQLWIDGSPAKANKRANGWGSGGGVRPPFSLSGHENARRTFAPSRRAKGNCT